MSKGKPVAIEAAVNLDGFVPSPSSSSSSSSSSLFRPLTPSSLPSQPKFQMFQPSSFRPPKGLLTVNVGEHSSLESALSELNGRVRESGFNIDFKYRATYQFSKSATREKPTHLRQRTERTQRRRGMESYLSYLARLVVYNRARGVRMLIPTTPVRKVPFDIKKLWPRAQQ